VKIELSVFREAFGVVDLIDSSSVIPSSQFVRMKVEGGKVMMAMAGTAFAESWLQSKEKESWTTYIDRRLLSAFLASAKTKAAEMTVKEDGAVTLRAGRQRAKTASATEIGGYGSWTQGKETPISLAGLDADLAMVSAYAPEKMVASEHLEMVQVLEGYGMLATDTFALAASLDPRIKQSFQIPPALSRLAVKLGAEEILVGKAGAAVQAACGYVYQAASAKAKEYPIKSVRDLAAKAQQAKTAATFLAKDLREGIEHLRKFVFGSEEEAVVECSLAPKGGVLLILKMMQGGSVEKAIPAEAADGFTARWPMSKLRPWLERVATVDPEAKVRCGSFESCQAMTTSAGKRKYVLVLAEVG
jgi:hypothetical protein